MVRGHTLLITKPKDGIEWCVWMTLPGHDPIADAFGFVIGTGSTRDASVADAVAALEDVVERLQAPRDPVGGIEERMIND